MVEVDSMSLVYKLQSGIYLFCTFKVVYNLSLWDFGATPTATNIVKV